MLRVNADAILF